MAFIRYSRKGVVLWRIRRSGYLVCFKLQRKSFRYEISVQSWYKCIYLVCLMRKEVQLIKWIKDKYSKLYLVVARLNYDMTGPYQ